MTVALLRCAIYTRVSSDAGLEQDFNSLDAQRESAEAYIRSQAHEGWRLVRDRFDDGGFSGGSMDRPALQKLLERIRERRIDIVVVYKVDRLTRSLADFAKLVELFDAHKVSFVSVTQSFNTTSSMGRLTLNVLLSFAQFEREVTGERIRDKIAASKQKGMWMGGVVPHGYRVEDRKLQIVEEEATEVRLMFDLYLAQKSVRAVQRELRERGIRTRQRVLATGRTVGGIFFTNGPISHILHNRHYVGEINHKGQSWPGEHPPIVDAEVFQKVQDDLQHQRRSRLTDRARSQALLLGKIFNDAGERLTPTYALKKRVRYRYYVSVSAMQSRKQTIGSVHRLPAEAIEGIVLAALTGAEISGVSDGKVSDNVTLNQHDTIDAESRPSVAMSFASQAELRKNLDLVLDRVIVRQDCVEIHRRQDGDTEERPTTLIIPWTKPSPTRHRQILEPVSSNGQARAMASNERLRLLRGIAMARDWVGDLMSGATTDLAAIASRMGKSERSVRMTLSLAFLDPGLIAAAVDGRLPLGFGVSRLADLPIVFEDQWKALGLNRQP